MTELNALLSENLAIVVICILVLWFFLFILAAVSLSKHRKTREMWNKFTGGLNVGNVEMLLENNASRLNEAELSIREMKMYIQRLESRLSFAIQSVGIVKYNAFDNVGNHLSFSLALLDQYKNGVVITSIYGRDFTTLYGKAIRMGRSEYPLSSEEDEAIDRAIKGENREKHI